MVKILFRFYLNLLLYSTNTTSTYSPVLMSGWRSRCICRGRGQSCSTVPLSYGRASFRCGNVSPIFRWSSKFVLLSPSKLPAAREAIHVSTGSCVTSGQHFVSLLWKHSCAFLLMVFLQSIITQLWLLPGGLTQGREQGNQTTMINLHSATLDK